MNEFKKAPKETIPNLLMESIPRQLIMGIEEALDIGAQRALKPADGVDKGHLPHFVGQLRHFNMNEAFHTALAQGDANPSAINGNSIVTGRSGIFTLARFNSPEGVWKNGRRSNIRRQMSYANKAIEPLVQPELFDSYVKPSDVVVFFVACFAPLDVQPDRPSSIHIAVPDRDMSGWLFKESVTAFLQRYQQQPVQSDLAVPRLKIHRNIDKSGGSEQ